MSFSLALPEDLKKEFRCDNEGKTSCSFRGLGRMFLIDHKSISSHCSGDRPGSILLQTFTEQGFDLGVVKSWGTTGVPDTAIPIIAEYYAFDAKQVSEETRTAARNFIRATSSIGVRTWFQHKLGFQQADSNDIMLTKLSLMVQEAINPMMVKLEEQNKRLDASAEERERLRDENNELNAVSREIDRYPHFRKLLDEAMNNIDEFDFADGVSCQDYIVKKLIPLHKDKWMTVSRRTAHYYLSTKGRKPEKRGNRNIYRGKDVAFIVATIAIVCQGL